MASEHYQEQVWDYVYGLLDEADALSVRAHVESCVVCREALTQAEAGREKLARAARVIREVPAFTIPGQTAPPTPATIPLVPAPMPAPALGLRKGRPRRYWLGVAAAAALLAVAFGLNRFYQTELHHYETRVAQVRDDLAGIDGRFAALQAGLEKETRQKARQLHEETPPLLQLLGPAQLQSETATNFNVATRDINGALKPATITTQVLDPKSNAVLHKQVDRVEGEGSVQVPPLKMDQPQARVVMEAKAANADAKIEELLRVAEPQQTSHLALNKSIYAMGDVAFFRSLTLDRFNLTPPAQPISLRYTLFDNNGRAVKELPGQTNAGGIGGGELALTPDLASGEYALQVSAGAGANYHVMPQSRRIEINRGDTPQIAFDRNVYKPGDRLGVNLWAGQGSNTYANQKVDIRMIADNKNVPQGPAQSSANLDSAGNLNNFMLQLPAQVKNSAEVVIGLKDGAKSKTLVQAIPVVPSERTIDFFPEGGDLVAGVPNRVYYRVRSPQGNFALPEGRVIVLAGKAVVYDSAVGQGLGVFTFTPDPAETYTVRITGTQSLTQIAEPFASLGIQRQGVILHAAQSLIRQDEPVMLELRNQGAARRLLLQTTCRGQIVDQQYVNLAPGAKDVKFQPAPGSAGVLRVTALEVAAEHLVPIAERLLFRIPDKRLDVACLVNNGPGPYAAGSKMALKLKVTDEHKNGGPTWMLAAVVDEQYLADKNVNGLATHFYLTDDVGDDLDGPQLAINDTPASRQALDLFLGTHGWRRFVHGSSASMLALNENPSSKGGLGGNAVLTNTLPLSAGLISAQNTTQQNLQNNYQAALQKGVSELASQANRRRRELADQKETSRQALSEAVRELSRFQEVPREYGRLALGIAALALLALGGVLVAVGMVRLIRKHTQGPTACFVGAFSCLCVCLFLYMIAGQRARPEVSRMMAAADPLHNTWPEFNVDALNGIAHEASKQPAAKPEPAMPQAGTIIALAPQAGAREERKAAPTPGAVAQTGPDMLAKRSEGTHTRGLSQNGRQMQNTRNDAARQQVQNVAQASSAQGNDEMSLRYAAAAARYGERERSAVSGQLPRVPAAAPTGGGGAGGFGAISPKDMAAQPADNYLREFAYRDARRSNSLGSQDTLYWNPSLFSADGQTDVKFDLSPNPGTYRILIYANSPSGRLGFYEGHFEVKAERK